MHLSPTSQSHNPTLWQALLAGLLLGAITVLITADSSDQGEDFIRYTLRSTGHISFLLFLVPMIARPLHQLRRSDTSEFLIKNRAVFGLAFAGNQIWHLGFIVALYFTSETAPEPLYVLLGGSFAMFYLFLMAAFSFPALTQWAGPIVTRRIHLLAFYVILGAFFYDIVLRNWPAPNPVLIGLLSGALLLRLTTTAMHTLQIKQPSSL